MQKISSAQLRAARALMNWSRADLAKYSGISSPTLHRIENGKNEPETRTIEKIISIFDTFGVEFSDNQGVRFKPQGVEILVGREGLCQFFDGVYEYTKKHGGTIVQLGMDETFFTNILGNYSYVQRDRMAKLVRERKDIKVLSIICEGDTNFFAEEYNEYRWFPQKLFELVPFYIYGENLGIMTFQTTPAPTIILHKFPAITLAYRKQFEVMWKISQVPNKQKTSKKV